MRIRSRAVYPVSRPPIENGGFCILNGRVAQVGPWDEIRNNGTGEIIDLGDSVVLPGLINAHCHLDYTGMAGKILPPKYFPDWIKAILALKASWSFSDYAASWLDGAEMLLRTGTTTVADIEAIPELIPEVWLSTPLRVISFFEMTGVKANRSATAILEESLRKLDSLPAGQNGAGLSPHALYSTKPDLLALAAEAARKQQLRTTTHLAESREEFEMFTRREGPLFDWLKSQRDMSDCGGTTPVQLLARSGLMNEQHLAVHVNYLGDGDADLLGTTRASVVHCPLSHAYFKHAPFPYETLRRAGVNVCLGTDSLASVPCARGVQPELNLFMEMRRFAAAFRSVTPGEIIRMATMASARALGFEGQLGELSPGAIADFIVLPCSGSVSGIAGTILAHQGPVSESWIAGKKVYDRGAGQAG